MKKVLLTNSIGPYALGWGEDMTDLFGARLTRGQGPFSLQGSHPSFGLHLIAENLRADVSVMEWPSEELFRSELKKGYDFLGIQVLTIHIPKIARMVEIAREVAPGTPIVLGGYGVLALHHPPPNDRGGFARYLLDNADHLCHEEGVAFFRKVIGQDPEEPITQIKQPVATSTLRGMKNFFRSRESSVLVALGCPNACEFCNTSAFYRFKKIVVSTPEQTVAALKAAWERSGRDRLMFHMLWDEDYLIDKPYVMRVGELMQKENLIGLINYNCFASIRSISQFTTEELVLAGIASAWIGVESKFEQQAVNVHNFYKRCGKDAAQVISELHRWGITIVGSCILGLDFHTPENIEEDMDYFVSLKPDFYQVAPLTPCPGTMLFERMQEEGRLYDHYAFEEVHIWSDKLFSHPHFSDGDLTRYFDLCHEKLVNTNGPAMLNIADVMLQGFLTMRHHPNPHIQQRAETCYLHLKNMEGGLLYSMKKLAPSEAVRQRAEKIERGYLQAVGKYTRGDKFSQKVTYHLIKRHAINPPDIVSDPDYQVTRYPGDGSDPKVVKRRNPLAHSLSQASVAVMERVLGWKGTKGPFPIKLADIDPFDVSFKSTQIEGDRISYVDEGQGEVLLMLHGNPTWSYLYRHLIADLKKDYRCVAPDLLGYGLSDKPPQGDYSMEAHIRRLGIFVEKLGLENITLVCQDWGGIIGLSYAARNKERFSRLIPMNTTGFSPRTPNDFKKCLRAWAMPYLLSFKMPFIGKKMAMDWNLFLQWGMRLGTYNTKRQMHRKAMLGYLYPFQRVNDRVAIMKSVRQIPTGPLDRVWWLLRGTEKALAGWDVRTRVIWGMKDPVFVPWFIERFEKILPNHEPSLKIATAGHFLQDDEPEAVILGIREFLGAVSPKKANPRRKI